MLKLFHHKKQNTIYKGDKTSASPYYDTKINITDAEANHIDKQEKQIKQLEKQAKNDTMLRFYIKGF